jgi:hypothetical protein
LNCSSPPLLHREDKPTDWCQFLTAATNFYPGGRWLFYATRQKGKDGRANKQNIFYFHKQDGFVAIISRFNIV